ncbi:MAG: type II toxin-antitoxin system RelE/ParE family toxin [Candidatus Omnitrophica bacterium]|nr:type II toxin-antitoxin system RelE/ParE family toxin [Candidatus Omnitrophota bacterium]
MTKTIIFYQTLTGEEPVMEWFLSFRDKIYRHRIQARIDRIKQGNYGDHKRLNGIIEIRMDFGKGYRLYCGEEGQVLVILLAGGDKSTQGRDIKRALEYWRDYHDQKKI